jgi:uncharacterized protein YcfL
MKKMMIFVIIGTMMISLTGCSSNEKVDKVEENGIKPIAVEEIQVENIETETIITENVVEEKYIDSEYLSELSYNSKRNSWN